MPNAITTSTRKQLYEKVWSTPITIISKEYHLSDVGMAKLCKRHNIPRPPRGYWARVEHGQKPPQAALPNPDQDESITIHVREELQVDPEIQEQADSAFAKIGPVPVREDLRGCHCLISEMREYLNGRDLYPAGIYRIDQDAPLDLKVSKDGQHRALRIMDALIKAMEGQGWTSRKGPVVEVLGVDISLSLSEGVKPISVELPADDLNGRYQFHHDRIVTKQAPSGEFTLLIDGRSTRYRRKIKDGIRQSLEDQLPKVLEGMVFIASSHRQDELERQAWHRKWEEEQRREDALRKRKYELKKQILAEKVKVGGLVREMRQWRQSQDLRAYIEARRARHLADRKAEAMDEEFAQWYRWALDQAARIDPLCPNPPSILDKATPDIMNAYEP